MLFAEGRRTANKLIQERRNVGGQVEKVTRDFEKSVLGLNKNGNPISNQIDISPIGSIRRYDAWRASQLNLASELQKKKPTRASAITEFVKQTDEGLLRQFEFGFARGDVEALNVLSQARGLAQEYAKNFKENRIVSTVIRDNELNSEQVVNLLLGSAEALPATKTASSKALKRVFNIVGRESEAGQAVVDQATQRLFAKHATNGKLDTTAFGQDWVKFRKNNQSIVEQIWSPEQIAILNDIGTRGSATDLVKIAGDILTVRAGVAGSAVAGSIRRLAGVQQPAAAGQQPLLRGAVARAGAVQLGTEENRNLGQ